MARNLLRVWSAKPSSKGRADNIFMGLFPLFTSPSNGLFALFYLQHTSGWEKRHRHASQLDTRPATVSVTPLLHRGYLRFWCLRINQLCLCWGTEYVTKDVEDTPFDARSVNDRNATTLFLTEMIRGMERGFSLLTRLTFPSHTLSEIRSRSRSDSVGVLPRASDPDVPIRERSFESSVQGGTRLTSLP